VISSASTHPLADQVHARTQAGRAGHFQGEGSRRARHHRAARPPGRTLQGVSTGGARRFRVSIMPNIYGEDAVCRLDKQSSTRARSSSSPWTARVRDGRHPGAAAPVARAHGMLLVTGPTGSGKTTRFTPPSRRSTTPGQIVTSRTRSIPARRRAADPGSTKRRGLLFARGLRSICGTIPTDHVGEIRDPETANIAVQSRAHGASRFHHRPREQRIRRDRPLHAHERRFVQLRLRTECDPGAAPGAARLPALREDCRPTHPSQRVRPHRGAGGRVPLSHRARCRECAAPVTGTQGDAELMILNDERAS